MASNRLKKKREVLVVINNTGNYSNFRKIYMNYTNKLTAYLYSATSIIFITKTMYNIGFAIGRR
jgi:hypothetical protein